MLSDRIRRRQKSKRISTSLKARTIVRSKKKDWADLLFDIATRIQSLTNKPLIEYSKTTPYSYDEIQRVVDLYDLTMDQLKGAVQLALTYCISLQLAADNLRGC